MSKKYKITCEIPHDQDLTEWVVDVADKKVYISSAYEDVAKDLVSDANNAHKMRSALLKLASNWRGHTGTSQAQENGISCEDVRNMLSQLECISDFLNERYI